MTLCKSLSQIGRYFIEEPTHPDDIGAHRTLAEAISAASIELGEHIRNRVLCKNFMQAGAVCKIGRCPSSFCSPRQDSEGR